MTSDQISANQENEVTPSPGAEIEKIEHFIETVGAFGLYQKMFMTLMQIQALFYTLCFLFISFAIIEPIFECHDQDANETLSTTCDVVTKCANYTMEDKFGFRSLRSEYPESLVIPKCTSQSFLDPLLSLNSIKEIISGLVFIFAGFLSDLIGRKPMILIGTVVMVLSIFGAAVSQNIVVFVPFWILIAIGTAIIGTAAPSLGNESTLGQYRLSLNFVQTWAFTYPITALIAYLTKDWRKMIAIAGFVGIPVFLGFLFFAESPRWLLVRRRYNDAAVSLNRMAWVNRRAMRYTGESLQKQLEHLQPEVQPGTNGLKLWLKDLKSIKQVLKNKKLAFYLLFVLWHYLTAGAIGTNFVVNAGEFSTNAYLSIAFVGIFRLWTPFVVIGLDIYHPKFSRKVFTFGSFFLVIAPLAVSALFSVIIEEAVPEQGNEWMSTVVAITALFSTSMSFGLLFFAIYQVTIEVFPTVSRSGAISIVSIASTIAIALGPQIVLMKQVWKPLHFVVALGCLMVSLVAAILVVPETKDKPLPDRFEDIELVLNMKMRPDCEEHENM